MKGPIPTALAALAFLVPCAWAQDSGRGLQALPDIYFYASPDPLARRVFAGQLADPDGGIVSAVRVAATAVGGKPAQARVAYQGSGTPADGLSLPAPAVSAGPSALGAAGEDLRDAPAQQRSSKAAEPGARAAEPGARVVKRSIAADQLFEMIGRISRTREKGSADKAWGEKRSPDDARRRSTERN